MRVHSRPLVCTRVWCIPIQNPRENGMETFHYNEAWIKGRWQMPLGNAFMELRELRAHHS